MASPRQNTRLTIHKGEGQRYRSTLHRGDGVLVALEGGSYNRIGGPNGRVPHDAAHFVVERAFGVERGLWGVLAAGGLVQNASFAGGRKPPHAERRAQAVVTEPVREQLRQAEVLVRAVADFTIAGPPTQVDRMRAVIGERWWAPTITADTLAQACEGLIEQAAHWASLAPGEGLELTWHGDGPS